MTELTDMDYKDLLSKYMKYIVRSEGVDFIYGYDTERTHDMGNAYFFSDEEWGELGRISSSIKDSSND